MQNEKSGLGQPGPDFFMYGSPQMPDKQAEYLTGILVGIIALLFVIGWVFF